MEFSLQDEWSEWFDKNAISEIYPVTGMPYSRKMNAIIRAIFVLTLLGFFVTRNYLLFLLGGVAIAVLVQLKHSSQSPAGREGFQGSRNTTTNMNMGDQVKLTPETLKEAVNTHFEQATYKNPFGNVLLTDIGDHPNREAAAPAFQPEVHSEIMSAVKKQTQRLNHGIPNLSRQVYGDVKDNFDLENSMRVFHSMPNTRVANDQGAFSQFLYGNMYSGKESTPEGAMMRVKDNYRYILM